MPRPAPRCFLGLVVVCIVLFIIFPLPSFQPGKSVVAPACPRISYDNLHPTLKTYGRVFIARKTPWPSYSGGVASLHELHNGLNEMGYDSYYWGLNPHFQNNFSKSWEQETLTEEDVNVNDLIVIPEVEDGRSYVAWKKARVASFFLGQHSNKKALIKRLAGTIYMPIISAFRDSFESSSMCYGYVPFSRLRRCKLGSLILQPPMESLFYKSTSRDISIYKGEKKNLVILDCDATDLASRLKRHEHITYVEICSPNTTYTRAEMLQFYKEAKAIVDLHVPGRERMLWEAAMHGACSLLAHHHCGHAWEWNVPDEWKLDRHNATQWDILIQKCIDDYDNSIKEFAKMRAFAWDMPQLWRVNINRYFGSKAIHFYTVASTSFEEEYALPWAASVFSQYPLATVEIILHNMTLFRQNWGHLLDHWEAVGGHYNSLFFTESAIALEQYGLDAPLHLLPQGRNHTMYTIILPITVLPVLGDTVNELVYALDGLQGSVRGSPLMLEVHIVGKQCTNAVVKITQRDTYWTDHMRARQISITWLAEETDDHCWRLLDLASESAVTSIRQSYCGLKNFASSLQFQLFYFLLGGLSSSLRQRVMTLLIAGEIV